MANQFTITAQQFVGIKKPISQASSNYKSSIFCLAGKMHIFLFLSFDYFSQLFPKYEVRILSIGYGL